MDRSSASSLVPMSRLLLLFAREGRGAWYLLQVNKAERQAWGRGYHASISLHFHVALGTRDQVLENVHIRNYNSYTI